jgi:hypothetical protein
MESGRIYTIYCTPPGDNPSFPINLPSTSTVGALKEVIRDRIPDQIGDIGANRLRLYRQVGEREEELDEPKLRLSDVDVFGPNGPPEVGRGDPDHLLVRLPESEPVHSALGGFTDNVPHLAVVPPAGESIKTTVCSTVAETVPILIPLGHVLAQTPRFR